MNTCRMDEVSFRLKGLEVPARFEVVVPFKDGRAVGSPLMHALRELKRRETLFARESAFSSHAVLKAVQRMQEETRRSFTCKRLPHGTLVARLDGQGNADLRTPAEIEAAAADERTRKREAAIGERGRKREAAKEDNYAPLAGSAAAEIAAENARLKALPVGGEMHLSFLDERQLRRRFWSVGMRLADFDAQPQGGGYLLRRLR